MCSCFNCLAFSDVDASIRIADNMLYLKLECNNSDVHLTLNPSQALILAQNLYSALNKFQLANLADEKNYGNLSVIISDETESNEDDDEDLSCVVPF